MRKKIRVGITMGDPSGIGPEIISKALRSGNISGSADFTIIGDGKIFAKFILPQRKNIKFIDLDNVPGRNFCFGKIKPSYGKAALEYVREAVGLFKNKQIDCLVTCPISKEAVRLAGLRVTGHTEFLADLCSVKDPLMMLVNKYLKFTLVTRHIAIKEVPAALDKARIHQTILSTQSALKEFFKISRPHIVGLALNPHASDGGLLGKEELKVIAPAMNRARAKVNIDGPLPADSAVLKLLEKKYDCGLAMYHDQALIPLKLTDAGSGVNLTWGLPFVRTSPLHGTAFDIAGKNKADPSSLVWAIKLAIQCAANLKNT
ncbi:MAG: 4-hydroxythreonine-4-phosphate dehydrogenase PdxA [Candidatus Omnitrophica bacterium]|nr:4-hydroxythreonine-4-phosphate dehydrogenase PdxA [Candidatus Omnitrophota bacterium]MDD5236831.1 4-hydroxythreonine-4-phosphate dehydrogenase PdxA [Candidatus Omnitrophota bacterium]MDD5611224.1 4-hydroxythreonine-4-phosphate dehydrogenase PdxA [Candidatus Omnitrophota bacterium]